MDHQYVIVITVGTPAGEAQTLIGPFPDMLSAQLYEDRHVDAPEGARAEFLPVWAGQDTAPMWMDAATDDEDDDENDLDNGDRVRVTNPGSAFVGKVGTVHLVDGINIAVCLEAFGPFEPADWFERGELEIVEKFDADPIDRQDAAHGRFTE